jgi:hypothetical protein
MIAVTPENYREYFVIDKLNPAHRIGEFNGDNALGLHRAALSIYTL